MKDRNYKCPVCGAPVEGEKCEYCGCVIYDFATISTENPCYIRMRLPKTKDGEEFILQAKVIAVNPVIELTVDEIDAVDKSGTIVERMTQNRTCNMSVDFHAVEDDDGRLFTLIDASRPYRESWRDDIE